MIVCRRTVLLINHETFLWSVTKNEAETQLIKEIAGILTQYTIPRGLLAYEIRRLT